jgi:hypothetical protein
MTLRDGAKKGQDSICHPRLSAMIRTCKKAKQPFCILYGIIY